MKETFKFDIDANNIAEIEEEINKRDNKVRKGKNKKRYKIDKKQNQRF